ncbi:hypothetical protein [Paenibacillus medicaginis]|uniref:Uncharacterized protein n=1 Tax=Paenibacillus medicaginis TaxID=1470560 RepID=A0ABV5BY64_9BACL
MSNQEGSFEEMHIIRREDGKGHFLTARSIVEGKYYTIEIPFLYNITAIITRERTFSNCSQSFELKADVRPENNAFYKATADHKQRVDRKIK